jgi:hypothetical protein
MQAQTEIDSAVWPQVDDLASSFDAHRTTVEVQNHPGRTLDLVDLVVVRKRYDELRQQYEKLLGLHNELCFERDQLQIQLTAVTGGQTAPTPLSVLLPPVPRSVLPLPLLPPVSLSVLQLPSLLPLRQSPPTATPSPKPRPTDREAVLEAEIVSLKAYVARLLPSPRPRYSMNISSRSILTDPLAPFPFCVNGSRANISPRPPSICVHVLSPTWPIMPTSVSTAIALRSG